MSQGDESGNQRLQIDIGTDGHRSNSLECKCIQSVGEKGGENQDVNKANDDQRGEILPSGIHSLRPSEEHHKERPE